MRRITSVYDLNDAICKSEGVEAFEEFGLGPLWRHSLVGHYFSVPLDGEEIFKVTSEEIISALGQFMYVTKGKKITADEFLDYLAKEFSAPSREALGVRIQSLGWVLFFFSNFLSMALLVRDSGPCFVSFTVYIGIG